MNKFIILIISAIIVITISCDSDSPVSSYDEQLKREIIGKWTDSEGYTVEFYENGFFRDTIFTSMNHGTIIDTMLVVRFGKYSITNSILLQTDFTFEYVYLVHLSGIAIPKSESIISINNNHLQRKRIKSFSNSKIPMQEIWGTWLEDVYFCQYSTDSSFINGPSYGKDSYTFVKDSTIFQRIVNYEYPVSYIDTGWYDYTYNKPYLDIPAFSYYNMKVEFESGKMSWYFDFELKDLIKIQ